MSPIRSPGLLVSVRDAEEAGRALAGGAALIDVKEPARGALGRADETTIAEVVRRVGGRVPVSAALGELAEAAPRPDCEGLTFVKWGLAGCLDRDWPRRLERELTQPAPPQTVIVAYADWQCAEAPPVDAVVEFACRHVGAVLLIDTCCKDASAGLRRRPTLLDWLGLDDVLAISRCCRAAGVRLALAGSLGPAEIGKVLDVCPDWIGVRGAACDAGSRDGALRTERVQSLVSLVASRGTGECAVPRPV
jgi:uncharacterized protein (UPF0264 family)